MIDECGQDGLPITFSEFPLNTVVADEYLDLGIRFSGDSPIIVNDGANPTSPVLSGQPIFSGDIEMTFVEPGTFSPATVSEVSFDVGYMNNSGCVQLSWWDVNDALIRARGVTQLGIVAETVSDPGIHRLVIDVLSCEAAGAAIDNVSFTTPRP